MLYDCNKNNNKIKSYKTKAEVVVKTTMCIEKHRDWRLGRLMLGAWEWLKGVLMGRLGGVPPRAWHRDETYDVRLEMETKH